MRLISINALVAVAENINAVTAPLVREAVTTEK
jgi:hypothetical protein